MNATCSPGCLNGAVCANGICLCSTTPFATIDDETVFLTGSNCGVVVPALVAFYVLTILLSITISAMSFREFRKQRGSYQKKLLLSNTVVPLMIGIFSAVHWAEGMRIGIYSSILLGYCLLHMNVQLGFSEYLLFSIIIRVSPNSAEKLIQCKKFLLVFNGVWFCMKIVMAIFFFAMHFQTSIRLYNVSFLVFISVVFIEVMSQCTMCAIVLGRICEGLGHANVMNQVTNTSSRKRQQVEAFAKKMNGQMQITLYYGITFLFLTGTIIGLFVAYDARIPFAWILFALYIFSWPTLCFGPIGLLRENVFKSEAQQSTPLLSSPTSPQLIDTTKSNQILPMAIGDSARETTPNNTLRIGTALPA